MIHEQICQSQIVAVVVGGRADLLCLLEKWNGFRKFAEFDVDFAEIVIGVVVLGLQCDSFLELLPRTVCVSQTNEVSGKVSVRRR